MDKKTIIQIICIAVLGILLVVSCIYTSSIINSANPRNMVPMGNGMMPSEENTEKDTKADDVEQGESINKKDINLNEYTTNVTITESGEYTVNGEFEHTLLINAKEDVTLILNGVTIKNNTTAAIANIGTGTLTIKVKETNTLSDGGSSEYDACIYSLGPLVIEGDGTLNIYGNQEEGEGIATETNNITINGGNINIECADDGLNAGGDGGTITVNDGNIYIKASGDGIDSNKNLVINGGILYTMGSSLGGDAGIDTDGGFEINGGDVIALGSDMLESPKNTSKQKSICFNLTERIESGTNVLVKDSRGNEVVSFVAKETFKTLIVSNEEIVKETYSIYVNDKVIGNNVIVK